MWMQIRAKVASLFDVFVRRVLWEPVTQSLTEKQADTGLAAAEYIDVSLR